MTRKRLTLLVVAVVVLAVFGATGAVAQEVPDPTNTTTTTTTTTPDGERIDNSTRLLNSSYDAETGEVSITLHSDTLQTIVLSDAGAFVEGGVVEQRSVTVRPDETITVTMPATRTERGYVGVSISTRGTLYAEPIEAQTDFFDGQSTWQTVQTAAVGGAFGVLVVTGIIAYRLRKGGSHRVERKA